MDFIQFMRALAAGSLLCLSACGTYTPEIQEYWADAKQVTLRESDLVRLTRCELGIALQRAFRGDMQPEYVPEPGHPLPSTDLNWLDKWGVQVTLTLAVIENTAFNPNATLTNVFRNSLRPFSNGTVTTSQNFTLAIGGSLSSSATTTDTLHLFYKVSDLHHSLFGKDAYGNYAPCPPPNNTGTLFTEDNFKIYDWLASKLFLQYSQVADYKLSTLGAQGQNGFTKDIKFEIVTNGSINPTWKFAAVTGNSGMQPLLGGGRDRTQDIIVTLGPIQQSGKTPGLAPQALNSHFTQELSEAFLLAIQSSRQP